ncbi:hypothetical protein StrepF001_23440 [Streptomyces sp. F001]|uniref:hypothetical protein n=1 Tax=Streptomyces sp. F001 TaxID=1510026 RepID=UPI00101E5AF2|nr:hypothetical protein [Streptomyces sp. F001]RZB16885.1 hypothetical protein StrepF001_23440 [Streptomyces sp. F001]
MPSEVGLLERCELIACRRVDELRRRPIVDEVPASVDGAGQSHADRAASPAAGWAESAGEQVLADRARLDSGGSLQARPDDVAVRRAHR